MHETPQELFAFGHQAKHSVEFVERDGLAGLSACYPLLEGVVVVLSLFLLFGSILALIQWVSGLSERAMFAFSHRFPLL
jgi:hypothetical protein